MNAIGLYVMAKSLKDRVIHGRGLGETFSGVTSSRSPKYKAWDESMMTKAVSAVTHSKGAISVREAVLKFGIPKSTLGDRVSG